MFLKNNDLQLRALEPEDLELLYDWENRPELWEHGSTLEPYSRYILKEYIAYSDKNIYEKRQLRLMIELNTNKQIIGTIDLFDFDPHHSRAGVGILIDTPFQKQGYAQQALNLLIDYAFTFLHIHQLYVEIATDNTESIALFRKVGFTESGILKSWLKRNNTYKDIAVMQFISTEV